VGRLLAAAALADELALAVGDPVTEALLVAVLEADADADALSDVSCDAAGVDDTVPVADGVAVADADSDGDGVGDGGSHIPGVHRIARTRWPVPSGTYTATTPSGPAVTAAA
jgi:hypothetical protein